MIERVSECVFCMNERVSGASSVCERESVTTGWGERE